MRDGSPKHRDRIDLGSGGRKRMNKDERKDSHC